MLIRPMTIEDCRTVAEIEAATFSDAWSYEVFIGCLMQDNYHMVVAADENNPQDIWGYFSFYTVLDEGAICNVCVRSDKRRQGVADEMMDYMLKTGKENGVAVFYLEVRESNIPAQKLYEKKGFVRNGMRKNFYSSPMENAILMQCNIQKAEDGR